MKKSDGFLQSLEQYIYKTVGRSPLPWSWVGVGVVGIVMLVSFLNVKNSVASAQNTREVVEKASERGDYATAIKLWNDQLLITNNQVLGAESELEEKVYPEKVVERRIAELESQLEQYSNHFEILLEISRLNSLIGNMAKSSEYREKARILDPNNAIFK